MALPAVAVGNVVEVKTYCYQSPQVGINVGHFQITSIGGTSVTTTQIAAYFDPLFGAALKNLINNTASYYSTSAQLIYPTPAQVIQYSATTTGIGTGGALPLPTQVAGIIACQTLVAGRAYRGRKYIPFPSSASSMGAGIPTNAYVGLLNTLAALWYTQVVVGTSPNQATLTPVIYHRTTPGAPTPTATFQGKQLWATQRKRGAFGQQNAIPL